MPRRLSLKPLQWSARDATGKQVAMYSGIYQGFGQAALRDGLTRPEIQRVTNACAKDSSLSRLFIIWFAIFVLTAAGVKFYFQAATWLAVATIAIAQLAILYALTRLFSFFPHPTTFILAMLDINRCPSCAYTLPHSAKSPEPVQCSECGSHWRYALD